MGPIPELRSKFHLQKWFNNSRAKVSLKITRLPDPTHPVLLLKAALESLRLHGWTFVCCTFTWAYIWRPDSRGDVAVLMLSSKADFWHLVGFMGAASPRYASLNCTGKGYCSLLPLNFFCMDFKVQSWNLLSVSEVKLGLNIHLIFIFRFLSLSTVISIASILYSSYTVLIRQYKG